jgi:uncharacterized protein YjiS (DUF1127 family)
MQGQTCITRTDVRSTDMTTIAFAALWSRTPLSFLRRLHRQAGMARSRRDLRRLDDHLLRDIGLTRHEAETEAARAPWDAPQHWRG